MTLLTGAHTHSHTRLLLHGDILLSLAAGVYIHDTHITYASLHNRLSQPFRLDLWPFALAYITLIVLAAPALQWEFEQMSVEEVITANSTAALNRSDSGNATSSVTAASAIPAPAPSHFYFMFAIPALTFAHVLTFLFAYWNVAVQIFLRFRKKKVSSSVHCTSLLCDGSTAVSA